MSQMMFPVSQVVLNFIFPTMMIVKVSYIYHKFLTFFCVFLRFDVFIFCWVECSHKWCLKNVSLDFYFDIFEDLLSKYWHVILMVRIYFSLLNFFLLHTDLIFWIFCIVTCSHKWRCENVYTAKKKVVIHIPGHHIPVVYQPKTVISGLIPKHITFAP